MQAWPSNFSIKDIFIKYYRVSQKKLPYVSNHHNSCSKVSFLKFTKFSFWTKIIRMQHNQLNVVSMVIYFQCLSFRYFTSVPFSIDYILTTVSYDVQSTGCPNLLSTPLRTCLQPGYKLVIFVKFFQLKLNTLNLIFSASCGPNWKILKHELWWFETSGSFFWDTLYNIWK